MAVPKRFKFKTKKKIYSNINNNQKYIESYKSKKTILKLLKFL